MKANKLTICLQGKFVLVIICCLKSKMLDFSAVLKQYSKRPSMVSKFRLERPMCSHQSNDLSSINANNVSVFTFNSNYCRIMYKNSPIVTKKKTFVSAYCINVTAFYIKIFKKSSHSSFILLVLYKQNANQQKKVKNYFFVCILDNNK